MSTSLLRVVERARREPEERFHSLAHLIDVPALERAFHRLRTDAAVGVDGVSKAEYEQGLEGNLEDLHRRLSGALEFRDGDDPVEHVAQAADEAIYGTIEPSVGVERDDFNQHAGVDGPVVGFEPSPATGPRKQRTPLKRALVRWPVQAGVCAIFP